MDEVSIIGLDLAKYVFQAHGARGDGSTSFRKKISRAKVLSFFATMRFVAVKSAEKQASGMAFKTRDLLVRQRTQTINALRGHMAEYGVVAPNGPVHIERLAEALQDSGSGLPAPVVARLAV